VNTRHGHHIPGTIKEAERPAFVKRCGGVNHCTQCTAEWQRWYEMNQETTNFIGEVRLINKAGVEIGKAKVEKSKSGGLLFHADIEENYYLDALTRGFSFGSFSLKGE